MNQSETHMYYRLNEKQKEALLKVVTHFILAIRAHERKGVIGYKENIIDFGRNDFFEDKIPTTRDIKMWADAVENIPYLVARDEEVDLKRIFFELEAVFHPAIGTDRYSNYVQDLASRLGVELPSRREYEQRR